MDKEITIYDVEQGSEAWFDLRCGRITASKFKDMMAKESTATYQGLINSTVGEIISKTMESSYTNEIMQRGIDLEPEAREFYSQIQEVDVEEIGFVTNPSVFEEYIGVSPDGRIPETGGLLEIKCPIMKTHVDYLIRGTLPAIYRYQVQGQLLVTGAPYCDFMSYYPSIKPLIIRIMPDNEIQTMLKERMEESIGKINELLNLIESK